VQHHCSWLEEDGDAHRGEHAVEVQLPFLQMRQPALRLVPIAVGTSRYEVLESLGEALAAAVQASPAPVLIVASSDMNHYEPDAPTRRKDALAIERMLALDPRGLCDVVTEHDISMCGFAPAVAMLTAANKLGAGKAELVKYATSGDVSGDRQQVVGYAGVLVY
jgi:AmmeMemoRadiSam system protein B